MSNENREKALQQIFSELNEEFIQIGENIYVRRSFYDSLSCRIFRYTSLDNLLSILRGKMYVSARGSFSDRYERGEYNSEELRSRHQKDIPFHGIRWDILRLWEDKMRITASFNVSSWTTKDDSYVMWKAYNYGQLGVCIESTVELLLSSISVPEGKSLYVSPMEYSEEKSRIKAIDILYSKMESYSDEHEIRLYFISKGPQKHEVAQPIYVNVNPRELIKNITLSPFISRDTCSLIINQLYTEYEYLFSNIDKSAAMEY